MKIEIPDDLIKRLKDSATAYGLDAPETKKEITDSIIFMVKEQLDGDFGAE